MKCCQIEINEMAETTAEYEKFVEKFKPKKTTDDCYTPDVVYDVVLDFAKNEYGISEDTRIIRPFYPGGDYQSEDYSGDCVVIDNPPFSILTQICRWYRARGIRYFLFAPSLTLFSLDAGESKYIVTNATITYENGARVNTSFVSNMGKWKIMTAPDLKERIESVQEKSKEKIKLVFPKCVISAARLGTSIKNKSKRICIEEKDAKFVRKVGGKSIFGDGFLVSDLIAEKIEKEKERKEQVLELTEEEKERKEQVLELTEEEKRIVDELNGRGDA